MNLKNITKKLAKIKNKIIVWLSLRLQYLPISSEILGPPKGYFESTWDWIANLKQTNVDTNIEIIHPSHTIFRALPRKIDEEIHWKFKTKSRSELPTTFVAIVPGGRIWSSSGAIITPDDKLLADVSKEFRKGMKEHSVFHQMKLPPVSNFAGTVAVLSTAAGQVYFHWMFDVLPRIKLLHDSSICLSSIDKFVINSINLSYQEQTLSIVGIPKSKIIESHKNTHIKAVNLVVPSLPSISGIIPLWVCNFLRNTFMSKEIFEIQDIPKRIYINRLNANYRKAINNIEVTTLLVQFGFKIVCLESIPFIEQVSLFAHAAVIVAPHGSGLTNLVFCKPRTKIIEFFSPNYVNGCYWTLSNQVNLDYYYLIGQGKRPPEYLDPRLREEDILINTNSLYAILKLAGVEDNFP